MFIIFIRQYIKYDKYAVFINILLPSRDCCDCSTGLTGEYSVSVGRGFCTLYTPRACTDIVTVTDYTSYKCKLP